MNSGTELAKSLFQNILGTKPTRVKLGHGSFITMDFGRDIPQEVKTRNGPQTRYFGEWHFWVYMCAWRIDKAGEPIYRNNLKNRFLAASALPHNFDSHSRLAVRQWSLAPNQNSGEPPCQIPDSSGCFGIAGCEDAREKIEVTLSELETRTLERVEILNNAFDVKCIFGEDMELNLFSFYSEEQEQWMLFTPENKTFTAGPGCQWSYRNSNEA